MFPLSLIPPVEETGYFSSDWRMSDDALFQLARTLVHRKPRSILETGPGISSYIFFKYQQLMRKELDIVVTYHIVDEKGEWHDRFRERMAHYNFPFDSVWPVPIKEDYYDVGGLYFGEMDFISLDGPSSSGHRNSKAAHTFIGKHLGPNTVVVIDDANRPAEAALIEWLHAYRLSKFGPDLAGSCRHDTRRVWDTMFPKRHTAFVTPA